MTLSRFFRLSPIVINNMQIESNFSMPAGVLVKSSTDCTGSKRIDIVSYGVAPSILLLSYGKFEPIFLVGAFLMLAASAIRLSYFSTFGLAGGTKYTGLALDNNNIIIDELPLDYSIDSIGIIGIGYCVITYAFWG